MAVKSKAVITATFEKGDRPTAQEFADWIDSGVHIASDGAVGFMEVISTASSIARPAETLVAIATAGAGGKVGVIEVLATAEVTTRSAGAVGIEILSAIVTASAQGHLGGGAVGIQVFEAATTASAQGHLAVATIVTASETVFGIVEIATQAEMEAAAATDRAVTPVRQHNHPAHCKAFANFNMAGTIVGTSFNVSGITDTSTSKKAIAFTNNMADANYGVVHSQENSNDADFNANTLTRAPAVSGFDIYHNSETVVNKIAIAVFGDQ